MIYPQLFRNEMIGDFFYPIFAPKMPRIAKRTTNIPLSPFRKLIPIAEKVKAKGKHIYHLNIGQPDIQSPESAISAIQKNIPKILEYSPSNGYRSYRKKMVSYFQSFGVNTLSPEDIQITTGASEALQLILFSCFDVGDEVIIPEPFYANYNGFSYIAEVNIVPITCHIEDGFTLPTIEAFKSKITAKTKGIIISNPNNPTGALYDQKTLNALSQLAKEHGLFLIIDEVYREFCFDEQEFYTPLESTLYDENIIVIDSVSKRYSSCGARIGAVISKNKAVISALDKYAKLRLSPPGLGQRYSEALIDTPLSYIQAVTEEYRARRDVVYNALQKMEGVISYLPGGAFYCFAQLPIEDAEHFCKWLLEDFEHQGATLMISPGQGFYATKGLGNNQVRIAYVLNTTDLKNAMECLAVAIEQYKY